MAKSHVIIDISPSSLEVVLLRGGRVVDRRCATINRSEWPSPWTDALNELKPRLAGCVAELGCSGADARLIYQVPGSSVIVNSCPKLAGRSGALKAGQLSLSSTCTFDLQSNPSSVRILHVDRASGNRTGTAVSGGLPRMHTLAAADHDQTVAALTDWASTAGLKVTSVSPAEAVITAAAVDVALAAPGSHIRAILWIGVHQSVLVVTTGERLELVRTIGAGTETLAEALTRPLRRPNGTSESAPITLDRDTARRLLVRIGVPAASDALPDELAGLTGSAVLPLLQPVIQRLGIEIKQTLRFGVSEARRPEVTLELAGDGAQLPNLAETLARMSGISAPTGPARTEAEQPGGLADAAARLDDRLVCLLGSRASDELLTRGLRRALLAGVAAAGLLLGIQGVGVYATLAKEKERLAAVKLSATGSGALAELQQRAISARVASDALVRRVADTMGQSTDWATALAVIAEQTPASIRLEDAEMSGDAKTGTPVCELRGYVRLDQTADAAAEIRGYIERLAKQPIIEGVKLGVTQRGNIRGRSVQNFELTLTLVALPAAPGERLRLSSAGGSGVGGAP